ncbi:MAG: hypothetical protein EKK37_08730 [Sphingobacteriales bacterium]|nr:MAG: hypothetical protein EKK37_08730 [Sphingobacteriales bacterium]
MKKTIWYLSVIIAFSGMVSCKKVKDNPFSDPGNFGKGTYLVFNKSLGANLDYSNLATSTIGINVSQYSGGEDITSIDVFVTVGASYDVTKWHKVKTVAYTSGGVDIKVSGSELVSALGVTPADITPGSFYTFYNRITTKSGKKFDVNNTADNNGSGLVHGPTYNTAFYFTGYIVCPYSGSAAGTYKVLTDDWADWNPGDLVTVNDGATANTVDISNVWPNPIYGTKLTPLTITVDPATGSATIPSGVVWGDYGSYKTSTLSGSSGYVFTCVGLITMSIHISATGYGDQGSLRLILKKQ